MNVVIRRNRVQELPRGQRKHRERAIEHKDVAQYPIASLTRCEVVGDAQVEVHTRGYFVEDRPVSDQHQVVNPTSMENVTHLEQIVLRQHHDLTTVDVYVMYVVLLQDLIELLL
ncbi:hypothetical protein D3C76_1489670 [compost metagenome]